MPLYVTKAMKPFALPKQGMHSAVCCDVVDIGEVYSQMYDNTSYKIKIRWQLEEINPDKKKHFIVEQEYTLSLGETSNLRPILESWRNKQFVESEIKTFDIESVIGANCQVQILHKISKKGNSYPKVTNVVPALKNHPKLSIFDDYVREVPKRDGGSFSEQELQEPIDDSVNYQQISDEDIPF